ncbi:universal stress protein [Amaricoccus macauensis]|uniref:universal stress protein n=1 Tax=Amaricoccus macauensis TaxID=57001 RepID=UPI003C7AB821
MTGMVMAAIDLTHEDQTRRILRKADELARGEDARLAVISVLPDFAMPLISPWFKEGAADRAFAEAGQMLHRVIRDALGEDVDARALHILRQGSVYEEVLAAAEKHSPSLIVMGAHRPDLRDYFVGPNAAHVVRHAKCSVLVLRD